MTGQRSICFCNSNIPWGGGEKWHFDAANFFVRHGWRVSALCHPKGELIRRLSACPNITLFPIAISNYSFLNPFLGKKIAGFFRASGVDSVIMNLPSDLKCVTPAAVNAGVEHIYYRRGSAIRIKNSRLNRSLFRRLTGVIANSQETKRLLQTLPPLIDPQHIHVIPNGIDISSFDTSLANAPSWEGKYPGVVLGNAGRLDRQKGQHLLLHLAAALKKRNFAFSLLIAGEGERREELYDMAVRLGVADCTHFLGFQPDLSSFWKCIDFFVLSSLWEGFGFVLAEAMLARKPIFAFRVSNIPELVQDGKNGFLFPLPENAEQSVSSIDMGEMAEAIITLAGKKELCRQMGETGRASAEANYSQEKSMAVLEHLLGKGEKTHGLEQPQLGRA